MSLNKLAKKSVSKSSFSNLSSITTKKLIQMNDVWASYDSKNYILKEINLSIERGTNYAIIGQSGSGKSTLLKLMNGMMVPSKGTIKIDYKTPNTHDNSFRKTMSKSIFQLLFHSFYYLGILFGNIVIFSRIIFDIK